jgi:hypothetical protein
MKLVDVCERLPERDSGSANFWSPAAMADRLTPARRTARASEPVALAAYPSPIRRFRPLSPVSSVNCTVSFLLP